MPPFLYRSARLVAGSWRHSDFSLYSRFTLFSQLLQLFLFRRFFC